MEDIQTKVTDLLTEYGPGVAYAILTLIIGLWVIHILTKGLKTFMNKKDLDPSLSTFLGIVVNIMLKILLVITVIDMVGVEVTSFIAILGAAGLAVGLALSGTLQNFAGGVMILILKPFKVGDYIEAQGYSGTVNQVQIFNTILKTPDNRTVIIPNGGLATNSILNYSTEPTRRMDFVFGISYDDDVPKAKQLLEEIAKADDRVLDEPEHMIAVKELADSSVNLLLRVWVKSENYWPLNFDLFEKVKLTFDKEGITIPFPQRDVHLHNENN